jgi:hypothetical protein
MRPTEALPDNQAVTPIRLQTAARGTPGRACLLLCLLTFVSATSPSWSQGRTQITFDGPPQLPPNSGIYIQQYSEAGVWCRPIGTVGPGNGFELNSGGDALWPENGTTYAQAALGDSLIFSFTNGSVFNLVAVDLAGYSEIRPGPTAVHFVGYRHDGTVVTSDPVASGLVFQTYYFDSSFSGLDRVEIPTYGWSLDNLILSQGVPEPNVSAVFVGGGLTLLVCRNRFRRSRPS